MAVKKKSKELASRSGGAESLVPNPRRVPGGYCCCKIPRKKRRGNEEWGICSKNKDIFGETANY